MAKITLSDIQLTYDGDTLTICSAERPQTSVMLDASAVDELIGFMQTLAIGEDKDFDADNRRDAFRVPVVRPGDLTCCVTAGDVRFEGRPANISMTGMYVRKRASDPIDLQIGDEVEVALRSGGEFTQLAAVVRRLGRDGYGLFFPCSIKNRVIDPPPEIRRIVMELQRRWMAHRSDLGLL